MRVTALSKLERICVRWGGALKLIDEPTFSSTFYVTFPTTRGARTAKPNDLGYYNAPASSFHGLHWPSKTVYAVREHANAGAIIHEMGHVFLDGKSPRHSNEWSWLGWEIALARWVGCYRIWDAQNATYGIGGGGLDGDEWGSLTKKEKAAMAAERIAVAQAAGIVTDGGRPTPRRRP